MRHKPRVDITGQRFGRLIASRTEQPVKYGNTRWECICDCGTVTLVSLGKLRSGMTTSCGCYQRDAARAASVTHGLRRTRVYRIWAGMMNRCTNENEPAYLRYGGRGITVCERWRTFENFFADMGHPPEGLTLERKENDLGYAPDNCKWATALEQGNNKRNNRLLTLGDVTRTLAQWSRVTGIGASTITARIDAQGYSVERALTQPLRPPRVGSVSV